jgi:hypothetical protein
MLRLELGKEVANLKCDCCGAPIQSVNGFVLKDDWAHAVYFATLQNGHDDIEVGLTISVGRWWEDDVIAVAQREWVYMRVWPSETGSGFEIRIEEPDDSRHYGIKNVHLGKALTCEDARAHPTLDDFFDVADFAVDNDPALLSYLRGEQLNVSGRDCNHA